MSYQVITIFNATTQTCKTTNTYLTALELSRRNFKVIVFDLSIMPCLSFLAIGLENKSQGYPAYVPKEKSTIVDALKSDAKKAEAYYVSGFLLVPGDTALSIILEQINYDIYIDNRTTMSMFADKLQIIVHHTAMHYNCDLVLFDLSSGYSAINTICLRMTKYLILSFDHNKNPIREFQNIIEYLNSHILNPHDHYDDVILPNPRLRVSGFYMNYIMDEMTKNLTFDIFKTKFQSMIESLYGKNTCKLHIELFARIPMFNDNPSPSPEYFLAAFEKFTENIRLHEA